MLMAEPVTLDIATAKLNEVLRKIGNDLSKGAHTQLGSWANYALKRFVAARLSGGTGALQRRTGNLARSFRTQLNGEGMDSAARFFTDARYAFIHEKGGTIRAKHARALAIPIKGSPALTPAGRQRYHSPLRTTLPRDSYNFSIHKTAAGKVFLMGSKKVADGKRASQSKSGRYQPWYQLVRSVYIRPRMHFADSLRLYVRVFRARLADMARKVMGRG